jgi:UDPglucose 6-dehydrogenase
MLAANRRSQKLSFTSNAGEAVRAGEAIFICVGTPPLENGDADLSAIDNVARLVGTEACESKLVVEKSTVPAQTGQQLKRVLGVYRRNGGVEFRVASNPEFLREGTAVEDFLHPDRIVFGVEDEMSEMQLREIYRPILERRNGPANSRGYHNQQRRAHQACFKLLLGHEDFLRQHDC